MSQEDKPQCDVKRCKIARLRVIISQPAGKRKQKPEQFISSYRFFFYRHSYPSVWSLQLYEVLLVLKSSWAKLNPLEDTLVVTKDQNSVSKLGREEKEYREERKWEVSTDKPVESGTITGCLNWHLGDSSEWALTIRRHAISIQHFWTISATPEYFLMTQPQGRVSRIEFLKVCHKSIRLNSCVERTLLPGSFSLSPVRLLSSFSYNVAWLCRLACFVVIARATRQHSLNCLVTRNEHRHTMTLHRVLATVSSQFAWEKRRTLAAALFRLLFFIHLFFHLVSFLPLLLSTLCTADPRGRLFWIQVNYMSRRCHRQARAFGLFVSSSRFPQARQSRWKIYWPRLTKMPHHTQPQQRLFLWYHSFLQ